MFCRLIFESILSSLICIVTMNQWWQSVFLRRLAQSHFIYIYLCNVIQLHVAHTTQKFHPTVYTNRKRKLASIRLLLWQDWENLNHNGCFHWGISCWQGKCNCLVDRANATAGKRPGSKHRFPVSSSLEEGCPKPVLGSLGKDSKYKVG